MKRKHEEYGISDRAEQEATEQIHRLVAGSTPAEQEGPSDAYWSNLLVRTNQRIDNATSGKAISISWLVRVAIPGVLAILSFLFGLHYYVPEEPPRVSPMASLIRQLPDESIDSVLIESPKYGDTGAAGTIATDIFSVTSDQIADYFITSGHATTLLESLTDEQVNELLKTLDTEKN